MLPSWRGAKTYILQRILEEDTYISNASGSQLAAKVGTKGTEDIGAVRLMKGRGAERRRLYPKYDSIDPTSW
jgi:hypothetical protein